MANDIEVNTEQQSPDEKDEIETNDRSAGGYKNPPQEHQFKRGKSGNPRGRPKGSQSRNKITERVLLERHNVDVDGSGRLREVTSLELVVLRLRQNALDGNTLAFNEYNKLECKFVRPEAPEKGGYLVVPEVDSWETWEKIFGPDAVLKEDKEES